MPPAKRPKWPEITWIFSPNKDAPRVLGINPWIYDFAAYNLWSRPVGLLACLQMFYQAGTSIGLLDCLERTWDDQSWPKPHPWGKGHFPKQRLAKPWAYQHIPRNYSRYGLDYQRVKGCLQRHAFKPDLILLTSGMTYWYPGAVAFLELIRAIWPKVPIVLGGTYASLCFEHARQFDFDLVIQGRLEEPTNWQAVWNLLGEEPPPLSASSGLGLALQLYPQPDFAPILGSRGCPFNCDYCASKLLYPDFKQKSLDLVWKEFWSEYEKGVRDFAFYDDALLVAPQKWLIPFLRKIKEKQLNVRLHTPNAMHVRYLNQEICNLFKRAGLTTIRLGLETTDFSSRYDRKLTQEEWEQGLANLLAAGFKREQIGVYILCGLPEQRDQEVLAAISWVKKYQLKPDLAYYSPLPGTKMFELAKECSPYPLAEEPLYQNNSIWPCLPEGFSWEKTVFWRKALK